MLQKKSSFISKSLSGVFGDYSPLVGGVGVGIINVVVQPQFWLYKYVTVKYFNQANYSKVLNLDERDSQRVKLNEEHFDFVYLIIKSSLS